MGKSEKERICKFFKEAEGDHIIEKSEVPCINYAEANNSDKCGLCLLSELFLCVEDLRIKMPTLTQSALKMFCQCPEKYKKHYVDGIVLKDEYLPDAMKLGLLWGAFMESENG